MRHIHLEAAEEDHVAHSSVRAAEQRHEVVEQWKAAGIYPYAAAPAGDSELLERETFDLVATTVHRHFPKQPRHQRMTLALPRETVKHEPDQIHRILGEVFRLTPTRRSSSDCSTARACPVSSRHRAA